MFLSFWGPRSSLTPSRAGSSTTRRRSPSRSRRGRRRANLTTLLRGFFRQFELYYVVADERDVIGVRTNHRGEHTYLYRMRLPPERARALLLDYFEDINRLADQPGWYNALIHNCTTTIR